MKKIIASAVAMMVFIPTWGQLKLSESECRAATPDRHGRESRQRNDRQDHDHIPEIGLQLRKPFHRCTHCPSLPQTGPPVRQ